MELRLICRGAEVEVQMDEALQNFLSEGFVDRAVRDGVQSTAPAVAEEIKENFNQGGRPSWGTDLIDTGALKQAATEDLQFDPTGEEMEVATDPQVDYASYVNEKHLFMVVPDGQPMDNVAGAFLKGAVAEIKE